MPYIPRKAPGISDTDLEALASSTGDLALYVEDELEALASALGTDEEFNINYAEPTRPREGLMVYADGTQWNPGDGEGLYLYKNAAWRRLQDSAPAAGVTSIDSTTGAFTLSYGLVQSSQALSVSLTRSSTTLGANVALNATGSYFDILSLSLAAGTWLVTATALANDSATSAAILTRLYDGTNTYASSATYSNNLTRGVAVTISAIITLGSTTIVKLQARGPDATTSRILFNQSGNSKDTHMTAVRIA